MIFPFFIFSLTEIGLVRGRRSDQPAAYLSGYYAVGVLASFTIGALILGTAIFIFFMPLLKTASGVGYEIIKSAARPLEPILIAFIRFLFGYAKTGPTSHQSSPAIGLPGIAEAGEMTIWMKILMWGGGVLLSAIVLAVIGLILWYAVRWLFQQRVGGAGSRNRWDFQIWWMRLKTFLYKCRELILRTAAKKSALEFYAALRRWGRHSGLSPETSETPREYGMRLAQRFPKVQTEILVIIDMLHREVYEEASLSSMQIHTIRKAWKKLHSPWKWPFRLKSLMNPGIR
jgi:hypothetical protein